MLTVSELKCLLTLLDYDEIEFFGFGDCDSIVYFDAFIDTYYRVMCKIHADSVIEVHDTTFDVDNYVKIADARKVSDKWVVTYN